MSVSTTSVQRLKWSGDRQRSRSHVSGGELRLLAPEVGDFVGTAASSIWSLEFSPGGKTADRSSRYDRGLWSISIELGLKTHFGYSAAPQVLWRRQHTPNCDPPNRTTTTDRNPSNAVSGARGSIPTPHRACRTYLIRVGQAACPVLVDHSGKPVASTYVRRAAAWLRRHQ